MMKKETASSLNLTQSTETVYLDIEKLYSSVRSVANSIAYQHNVLNELDDLHQIGMLAILEYLNSTEAVSSDVRNLNAYLQGIARFAILQALRKRNATLSLDMPLSKGTDTTLADTIPTPVVVSRHFEQRRKRRQALAMLYSLSPEKNAVLRAAFRIEDKYGRVADNETVARRYGLRSKRQITDRRFTAYKQLRRQFGGGQA